MLYQALVNYVLRDMINRFEDDILLVSQSLSEHEQHVHQVPNDEAFVAPQTNKSCLEKRSGGKTRRGQRGMASGNTLREDAGFHREASNLLRAASLPNVGQGNSTRSLSSITISTRRVGRSGSCSDESTRPSRLTQPLTVWAPLKPESSTCCSLKASSSQPDLCRKNLSPWRAEHFNQRNSAVGKPVMQGERKFDSLTDRDCITETDKDGDSMRDSFKSSSSRPIYRSSVYLELPFGSASAVLFLDKSLFISLMGPEKLRATHPGLHTSTLSVRREVSPCQRVHLDSKLNKTDEGRVNINPTSAGSQKHRELECCSGHQRGPLSKQHCHNKVEGMAPTHGVDNRANNSDTRLEILSFRGTHHSPTESGGQNRNEDVSSTQSNFKLTHQAFNTGPVDIRTGGTQSESMQMEAVQGCVHSGHARKFTTIYQTELCHYHSGLTTDSMDAVHQTLSLKEALELLRPDFISRSRGRVRRLEQRARTRRALQGHRPDLGEEGGRQKGNCTTPHPLSNNLFKPRERSISGREMQLRSRRIYNRLPEVTKRHEEERKKAVSQSNRLRAELFKKRLLDQILQR